MTESNKGGTYFQLCSIKHTFLTVLSFLRYGNLLILPTMIKPPLQKLTLPLSRQSEMQVIFPVSDVL